MEIDITLLTNTNIVHYCAAAIVTLLMFACNILTRKNCYIICKYKYWEHIIEKAQEIIFLCNNKYYYIKHKCLLYKIRMFNISKISLFIFTRYFLSHLSIFGFLIHSPRTAQSDKSL